MKKLIICSLVGTLALSSPVSASGLVPSFAEAPLNLPQEPAHSTVLGQTAVRMAVSCLWLAIKTGSYSCPPKGIQG